MAASAELAVRTGKLRGLPHWTWPDQAPLPVTTPTPVPPVPRVADVRRAASAPLGARCLTEGIPAPEVKPRFFRTSVRIGQSS